MAKETEKQMLERLAKRHPDIYKKLPPKPKPNPKNKKKSKIEELTGKTREEIEKEYQESLKRIDEYLKKPRKRKSNQMDRSNPRGIDVKNGGLVLRVTRKGPLYKGKKSGSKKT
jgi:hypothetical protein|tara:strand:- start:6252 stop:6593 length:342 start_codon:yes stop_codon:yes gene_type:complete